MAIIGQGSRRYGVEGQSTRLFNLTVSFLIAPSHAFFIHQRCKQTLALIFATQAGNTITFSFINCTFSLTSNPIFRLDGSGDVTLC